MNNTYFLDQVQQTVGLNAELIMRQYKLNNMAKFMEIRYNNPKLKQSEIAKSLELSSFTIQGYRREIKMFSLYRIPQSSRTNKKRHQTRTPLMLRSPQMTSNLPQMT